MIFIAEGCYLIGCVRSAGSYSVDGMSGSNSACCMIAMLLLLPIGDWFLSVRCNCYDICSQFQSFEDAIL